MLNWLKWKIAKNELFELERWRILWGVHRQWFAEFPDVALVLDHLKAEAKDEPVTTTSALRESMRAATTADHAAQAVEIERLTTELRHIAIADVASWDDPSEFRAWAQNRARFAIAKGARS